MQYQQVLKKHHATYNEIINLHSARSISRLFQYKNMVGGYLYNYCTHSTNNTSSIFSTLDSIFSHFFSPVSYQKMSAYVVNICRKLLYVGVVAIH